MVELGRAVTQPVPLATFRTRLQAAIAAGLLDHAGLPFVIQSPEGIGMGPLSEGASLLVRADDVEAARRVLADAGVLEDPS
jgi:hypothetical protein